MARIVLNLGDDQDCPFEVRDPLTKTVADIEGWTFEFIVKAAAEPEAPALLQLTSSAGGVVIDTATEGRGRILLRRAGTAALQPGRYYYQLRALRPGDLRLTVQRGIFIAATSLD